jgi:hypothetical protein
MIPTSWPGQASTYRSCGVRFPGSKPCAGPCGSASWLRDTIPGATEVVELAAARLFFPDERATEFTAALRRHWDVHP